MFFFNLLGIGFLAVALLVAIGVHGLLTGDWDGFGALGFFALGTISLGVDLTYRTRRNPEAGNARFVSPSAGGSLMFIPVWILGVIWLGVGVFEVLTGGDQVRARHNALMNETANLLEKTADWMQGPGVDATEDDVQDQLTQCEAKLQELRLVFQRLGKAEQRRLDQKYGDRLENALRRLRLQGPRLNLQPN